MESRDTAAEELRWRGEFEYDYDSGLAEDPATILLDDGSNVIDIEEEHVNSGSVTEILEDGIRNIGVSWESDHAAVVSGPACEEEEDFVKRLQESIERDLPKVQISKEFQAMLDAVEADMKDKSHILKDQKCKEEVNGSFVEKKEKDIVNEVGLREDSADGPLDLGVLPPRQELGIQGLLDAFVDSKEEECGGSEGSMVSGTDVTSEPGEVVFRKLQPICSKILQTKTDSKALESMLVELTKTIEHCKSQEGLQEGLQDCLNYILLPYNILLDALVSSRNQPRVESFPALKDETCVLALLRGLLTLAQACAMTQGQQMMVTLEKLRTLLALDESLMSEHPRQLASQCMVAILAVYGKKTELKSAFSWLREEENALFLGTLISTLLNHPYNDVTNPARIDQNVQIASLNSLKCLMSAIDEAEPLAFFVPGIATSLVKRILMNQSLNLNKDKTVSKSSASLIAAIESLQELLIITLNDTVVSEGRSLDGQKQIQLGLSDKPSGAGVRDFLGTLASSLPETHGVNAENEEKIILKEIRKDNHNLRVTIDDAWISDTSQRIRDMLQVCLPSLCFHENVKVRKSVTYLTVKVMKTCSYALDDGVLREMAMILGQDDWPHVRNEAGAWLSVYFSSSPENAKQECKGDTIITSEVLEHWVSKVSGLTNSLKAGDLVGRKETMKLLSQVEFSPFSDVASRTFSSMICSQQLVSSLIQCCEIDAQMASLLARAPCIVDSSLIEDIEKNSCTSNAHLLHNMPSGMKFISSKRTFDTFSRLIRSFTQVAIMADSCSDSLFSGYLRNLQESCMSLAVASLSSLKYDQLEILVDAEFRSTTYSEDSVQPWQLKMIQTITVLSNIIAGTSILWDTGKMENLTWKTMFDDVELEKKDQLRLTCRTVILKAFNFFLEKRIWLMPTVETQYSSDKTQIQAISKKQDEELTFNTLLHHSILQFIGMVAGCLGQNFAKDSMLMHISLLPVLEKITCNASLVSAEARRTVMIICSSCGYGSLENLVRNNIDYIVDGMCLRLRQSNLYPSAPKLFAALLKESEVAATLVPLLAEPASHAIKGLSILSRRQRPENIVPFIACMQEIGKGSHSLAKEAYAILSEVRPSPEFQEEVADPSTSYSEFKRDEPGMEEIAKFFEQVRKESSESKHAECETITVSLDIWNQILKAKQDAVAVAILCQSILDAISPLILSNHLAASVQASEGAIYALRGLHAANACLELCEKSFEGKVVCPGEFWPVLSNQPPKFLPSVHLAWLPLMKSLEDWRVAVLTGAIRLLQEISILAPRFIARRFQREAWPRLKFLLANGPKERKLIVPGYDASSSQSVIIRIQQSVLQTVTDLADKSLEQNDLFEMILPITRDALSAVGKMWIQCTTSAMRENLESTFVALSKLDPDAAWICVLQFSDNIGAELQQRIDTEDLNITEIEQKRFFGLQANGNRNHGTNASILMAQELFGQISAFDIPWHASKF
eukprot:jgi/Picsp_1/4341/NSC_01847-R2_---NA---